MSTGQGAAQLRGRKITFDDGRTETLVFDLNAQVFLEEQFEDSFVPGVTNRIGNKYDARDMVTVIQAGLLYKLPDLTYDETKKMGFSISLVTRLEIINAMTNAAIPEEKVREIADQLQEAEIEKQLIELEKAKAEGRPTGGSDGSDGKPKPTTAAESSQTSSGD